EAICSHTREGCFGLYIGTDRAAGKRAHLFQESDRLLVLFSIFDLAERCGDQIEAAQLRTERLSGDAGSGQQMSAARDERSNCSLITKSAKSANRILLYLLVAVAEYGYQWIYCIQVPGCAERPRCRSPRKRTLIFESGKERRDRIFGRLALLCGVDARK